MYSRRLVVILVFEGEAHYGLENTHVWARLEQAPKALSVLVSIIETGRAQTFLQMSAT